MLKDGHFSLHTDKYQINMMYAHWKNGTHLKRAVFEAYFRKLPYHNGFAVFAGLQRVVEYLRELRFEEGELAYLAEQEENYDPAFLEELKQFRFAGNLRGVPEGTIVFPNEPLVQVESTVFEGYLVETAILNFINYQTLIATKAARIRRAAGDDVLLEFGTRRAQEADAAVWGARAAYLAGFQATSNVRAGYFFDIPVKGTHSHAWVQQFDEEEEAFFKFAEALPDQVTLLVDTYDTLRSGVPHAIQVGKYLESIGKRMNAIRLDSGDLAYLSIQARKMLDDAGLSYVKICASNDLDEHLITHLKTQGACIDIWGVGTQLITGADQPALGGVYKLVAREVDGRYEPTIKISSNPEKVTTPGFKRVYRVVNPGSGKAEGDYVAFHDEHLEADSVTLFDPVHTWIEKTVAPYEAAELLLPIIEHGRVVYDLPSLPEIKAYHESQFALFWEEYMRALNPEKYPVDLSKKVWTKKMSMLKAYRDKIGGPFQKPEPEDKGG